jgi:hypothetical protein
MSATSGYEPPRVCRRLQILRDWSYDESQDVPEVLGRGACRPFEAQHSFAIIECGKWVGAAAFNGVVVAANAEQERKPGLLNEDAFGRGWMLTCAPTIPIGARASSREPRPALPSRRGSPPRPTRGEPNRRRSGPSVEQRPFRCLPICGRNPPLPEGGGRLRPGMVRRRMANPDGSDRRGFSCRSAHETLCIALLNDTSAQIRSDTVIFWDQRGKPPRAFGWHKECRHAKPRTTPNRAAQPKARSEATPKSHIDEAAQSGLL